jgi:hypothetical protein
MWRGFAVAAAALVVLVGCATTPPATQGTQLYLAVELKEDGVVVGAPQLLGFAGKSITVERRKPGAATADYKLELSPRGDSAGYRLGVQLDVRGRHGKGELGLLHGEERAQPRAQGAAARSRLARVPGLGRHLAQGARPHLRLETRGALPWARC